MNALQLVLIFCAAAYVVVMLLAVTGLGRLLGKPTPSRCQR